MGQNSIMRYLNILLSIIITVQACIKVFQNTVIARIVPVATIKGFEYFGASFIRVATLQILLT